ncbi:MAG TPA: UDP-N-acetylmuramoyl-L-alanyl-D-glutamate--2,6-diaminopimelate ligase [Acidimicrobiia bacterium]|nr:UDP-N-acetylmuramoyl-L-alanyl-D-glutamate--2,6-diaminopimelate ligase [Acidimicrobiia bacterium]
MRLHELLGGIGVLGWVGDRDVEVSAITHDSRRAAHGSCFACIPGAVTDGHLYAPAAVDAGAVALLVERELDLPVAQARVPGVRAALGPAAAAFYGHPSRAVQCLGVTGTNGKTTVTYLLEAIARAAGLRVGVVGTVGARVDGSALPLERTTPEADDLQAILASMRADGVRSAALEVSSHALDQHRVDGTWFAAACFTNLSQDHLDYHGSMEAYFEAKAGLFDPTRTGAAAVNVGDHYGLEIARRARDAGLAVMTFAVAGERDGEPVDVVADDLEATGSGTRFVLVTTETGASAAVDSRLLGAFNVSNALAAATTALVAGFPLDAVVTGLQAPLTIPGRLERVVAPPDHPFTVLVDYAHTPDALDRVLAAARRLAPDHRVIVVFGSGGDRDRRKRPAMGRAAARGADTAVLTSDNPRSEDPEQIARAVLDGLRDGTASVVVELDRRTAIRDALHSARGGDVVVIAGKGHETGQTIGAETIPFDDRVVAREELEALGCA